MISFRQWALTVRALQDQERKQRFCAPDGRAIEQFYARHHYEMTGWRWRVGQRPRWLTRRARFARHILLGVGAGVCGTALLSADVSRPERHEFVTEAPHGREELRLNRASLVGAGRLAFSQGAVLNLRAGSLGRVTRMDSHLFEFALESGQARVTATAASPDWQLLVGPFQVRIHNGSAEVSWDAAKGQFLVRAPDGIVTVRGDKTVGEVLLPGGQWRSYSVDRRSVAASTRSQ